MADTPMTLPQQAQAGLQQIAATLNHPRSAVPTATQHVSRLEELAGELHDTINALERVLGPVLSESEKSIEELPPLAYNTAHAAHLAGVGNTIDSAIRRLRSLLRRVDL